MARSRQGRKKINGVVVLDKPVGELSNRCLRKVQGLLQAAKAGHTGSLDPMASGVLPLCFGETTKLSRFLLEANKTYLATVQLGISTTTDDSDGEVTAEKPVPAIDRPKLEKALSRLQGRILQTPPMYSALKHQGQALYKLARRGITIERKPRTVEVFTNQLLHFKGSQIELKIACSKGTYIRTIAKDLGDILDCGAHLCSLRRTASGPYQEGDAVDFAALEDAVASGMPYRYLKPIDSIISDWPAVGLTEPQVQLLIKGQRVPLNQALAAERVRITQQNNADKFLGIGRIADRYLIPTRLIETTSLINQSNQKRMSGDKQII